MKWQKEMGRGTVENREREFLSTCLLGFLVYTPYRRPAASAKELPHLPSENNPLKLCRATGPATPRGAREGMERQREIGTQCINQE